MTKKTINSVLFLTTNVAIGLFAKISDEMHGTSAQVVVPATYDLAAYLQGFLALIPILVVLFGQSIVFHFAASHSDKKPVQVSMFVVLNLLSAIFCSYHYVVQTDSSRIFFFALHWATSWLLAIVAAIVICTMRPHAT